MRSKSTPSSPPARNRGAAVRAEFGALATAQARLDWINGLGNAPDAGFKLRTAVIMMLMEGGIDDWETLSRINRVDDGIARDFARSLAQLNGTRRGDDLRNDQAMLSLANLAAREGAVDVPQDRRAVIPATSPEQWNRGIRDAIGSRHPERIPHDIKALLDEAPGHVRQTLGSTWGAVGSGARNTSSLITGTGQILPVGEGIGMTIIFR